jgi:hypothetical protein
MRLSRVRGLSQGVEHVRGRRKARISGLEAIDAFSAGLGGEESFADLDDLA